jgi:hypothetical protein
MNVPVIAGPSTQGFAMTFLIVNVGTGVDAT